MQDSAYNKKIVRSKVGKVFAQSERVVPAQPAAVYAVLTDYKNKRPQMLTPNFLDYKVERGGSGAGTEVSYRLHAARRERPYHMRVDEAIPGKVLMEKDRNSSLVTTWTLAPLEDEQTLVRITTEWDGSSGVGGFFERTFAPLGLHRIYDAMLELLTCLLPPSTTKWSPDVKNDANASKTMNAGVFFLLFGIVVAFAFMMSYLRKMPKKELGW